jgi:hypothetical protein
MKGGATMNMHLWMARASAIGALAMLAGCSNTGEQTTSSNGRDVTVTIRGTNAEGVRSLPLALSDVNITIDGKAVSATSEPAAIDLASGEERVAARFTMTGGTEQVLVELKFDDYGGYESSRGQAGILVARGSSVVLTLPAAVVAEQGKAELTLDLARSLAETGGGETREFSPQLAAHH